MISGAVYLYDDNNEVLDTNYVSAEGEVYGICIYHYKNEISLSYYTKEYTGKSKKNIIRLERFNICLRHLSLTARMKITIC